VADDAAQRSTVGLNGTRPQGRGDLSAAPEPGSSLLRVVALNGSPRRTGNTAFAIDLACGELERRGVRCEQILLAAHDVMPCKGHDDCGDIDQCPINDDLQGVLDKVWAADALIFATPVYFMSMSGYMKTFLDRTNHRYLSKQWLTPRVVGLIAVGAHQRPEEALVSLRRYIELISPSRPPIETATGRAEMLGEAEQRDDLREAVLRMASRMADHLLARRATDRGRLPGDQPGEDARAGVA
jgi:NAD(P)H-dependent FMN reductase